MRVMEVGLNEIAKELAIPIHLPSWDAKLKKIEQSLIAANQPGTLPAAKRDFFNQVTAHWRAVQTAWRNPTMHVEKKYTPQEATEIFNAVTGFIRHLATQISESPSPTGPPTT